MTDQPEPSLVQLLRAAADWIDMASLDDFDAANPWVDARNPDSREVTICNLLRAAADRLEAESKGITLDTELGQERDEKAQLVAEVARLREENANLRAEVRAVDTAIDDRGVPERDCTLPLPERVSNIISELKEWRHIAATGAMEAERLRAELRKGTP